MSANKTVIKTLKILELISKNPNGITLSEIYRELDMPKATVYDILQSLYQEDAVYYKNENAKTYVIGSKLFTIGQSYTKNSNFITFAGPKLREFADKYGVTVFGCKRVATKVSFVYKYESAKSRLVTPDVAVQLPLYENLAGKAFLTFLNEEKRIELLNRILKKDFNGKQNTEYRSILSLKDKHFEKGYIFDNGINDSFVCDLAIPVYNFENKMTGVIYATRFVFDEKSADVESYIREFKEIADYVSSRQGYQG